MMDLLNELISQYEGDHIFLTDVRDGCVRYSPGKYFEPLSLVETFINDLKKIKIAANSAQLTREEICSDRVCAYCEAGPQCHHCSSLHPEYFKGRKLRLAI